MVLSREYYKIPLIILTSTVITSLIVAMTCVGYMQKRFNEYDKAIFNRIVDSAAEENLATLFENIHEQIIDRDIVIAVNSSGEVVESEGLVVGEGFESTVNSKVSIEDYRIFLDSKQFDLETYIVDIDVSLDDVLRTNLDKGIRIYYIPNRLVWENDYLMNILPALSVACFTSAFGILIIKPKKDIKSRIDNENDN